MTNKEATRRFLLDLDATSGETRVSPLRLTRPKPDVNPALNLDGGEASCGGRLAGYHEGSRGRVWRSDPFDHL
jgi:hypothetical protein